MLALDNEWIIKWGNAYFTGAAFQNPKCEDLRPNFIRALRELRGSIVFDVLQ